MPDSYRHLLVRKNFSARLTRLEADDLEMDGVGGLVEGPVGQDPPLVVTELLDTADIVVGIQTGKQRRIDVIAGFDTDLVVVVAVGNGVPHVDRQEAFAGKAVGLVAAQVQDGRTVVLIKVLVEAHHAFFERLAGGVVGRIDFQAAVPDAHRTGHVAHADLVVADHILTRASRNGSEADHIDARLREIHINVFLFPDVVVAGKAFDRLGTDQRAVLAERLLGGVPVAFQEKTVVEQAVDFHLRLVDIAGIDLIFDFLARRHGLVRTGVEGTAVHSVDQTLDLAAERSHILMPEQVLRLAADPLVVFSGGTPANAPVGILLMVAQLLV